MDSLSQSLQQLGLSQTEITIYRTGLQFPSFAVADLQNRTTIKRPTIYHALHTLQQKGLLAQSMGEYRLQFVCTSPERVISLLKEKMADLDRQAEDLARFLPLFALPKAGGTVVAHYEGAEGVKTAVDIALYARHKQWDIIAPKRNFFSEFDPDFARYYLEIRRKRGILSRTLWEKDLTGRRLTEVEIVQRQPRFLPEAMHGTFQSMLILFDDKVLLISSSQTLSAIIITSEELGSFFHSLFEGLWAVSEPYASALQSEAK